jgi:hypothetical protein
MDVFTNINVRLMCSSSSPTSSGLGIFQFNTIEIVSSDEKSTVMCATDVDPIISTSSVWETYHVRVEMTNNLSFEVNEGRSRFQNITIPSNSWHNESERDNDDVVVIMSMSLSCCEGIPIPTKVYLDVRH